MQLTGDRHRDKMHLCLRKEIKEASAMCKIIGCACEDARDKRRLNQEINVRQRHLASGSTAVSTLEIGKILY